MEQQLIYKPSKIVMVQLFNKILDEYKQKDEYSAVSKDTMMELFEFVIEYIKPVEQQLIYKKIPIVMGKVKAIAKDSVNKVQGYKFRGIDAVYNGLNKILSEEGVFTTAKIKEVRREERQTKNSVLMYTILDITYKFYAEDGSYIEHDVVGEAMDTGDKATNKAMSVAQKYAFFQIFCIPTEEDKDPENDSLEIQNKEIEEITKRQSGFIDRETGTKDEKLWHEKPWLTPESYKKILQNIQENKGYKHGPKIYKTIQEFKKYIYSTNGVRKMYMQAFENEYKKIEEDKEIEELKNDLPF